MKQSHLSTAPTGLLQIICLTLLFLALGIPTASAQTYCGNETGNAGSTGYENWRDPGTPTDGRSQTHCMTVNPNNNTFSAEWENTFNYLARRGLRFNPFQDPGQIGWISADYAVEYYPSCDNAGSNSYMGLYGWAKRDGVNSPDDLIEWYIIEAWCNYTPAIDQPVLDTVVINGAEYDIVKGNRWGQPSIEGDRDFVQYFSVRRHSNIVEDSIGNELSGSVDVSQHFEAWEDAGLPMGNINEVSMLVEGYGHGSCGEAQTQADVEANGRCKDTPNGTGTANFTDLEVNVSDIGDPNEPAVTFREDAYNINTWCEYPGFPPVATFDMHAGGSFPDIAVTSSNPGVLDVGGQLTYQFLMGLNPGSTTITLYSPSGDVWDTAQVVVSGNSCASPAFRSYTLAAQGTLGDEEINVTLDGASVNSHTLSTNYEVYSGTFVGDGEVSVEFVNDDGMENGSDVRLDYIEVDGVRRETEDMTYNSAAYANGICGGGSYTEWLHCNGSVNYGEFESTHTITIRARGNAGGEHINLLIDGEPVNGGWWLGTTYQEYTATVSGDGDINVEFDNDGDQRDVIIDWVKVDNQEPRQAENMEYNTGAWGNGQCGGGSYTQWLHCNGVIGFGNISDNFN